MREREPVNLEQDPRFPSGAWTGFFLQYWLPGRHATNVAMTFDNGSLSGSGSDWVGPYTVEGSYDVATGACEWIKQYRGKHSVYYRGVNNGKGIWGTWEIRLLGGVYVDRGGFHLWPQGTDVSEESEATERAVLAVMHEHYGTPASRMIRWLPLLVMIAALVFLLLWARTY